MMAENTGKDTGSRKSRVVPTLFTLLFTLLVAVAVLFFWVLPEIGHRILLKDGYYGLEDKIVLRENPSDCEEIETITVKGKFLGVYSYGAGLILSCSWDVDTQTYDGNDIEILAQKPHTFLFDMNRPLSEMQVSSYREIYRKKIKFKRKDNDK